MRTKTVVGVGALLTLLAAGAPALAQDDVQPGDLEQRLRILERKLEVAEEEKAAKAREATSLEFKFKGLLQLDGRFYKDDRQAFNDGFIAYLSAKGFNGGTHDALTNADTSRATCAMWRGVRS